MKRVFALLLLPLFWASFAFAQQDADFGTTDRFDNDDVNLFTLVPTIHLNVANKNGAFPLDFQFIAPQTCYPDPNQTAADSCNGDFIGISTAGSTIAGYKIVNAQNPIKVDCPNTGFAWIYKYWYVQTSDSSTTHLLPALDSVELNEVGSGNIPTGNCTPTYSFTDIPTDNSGFTVTISIPPGTLAGVNGQLSSIGSTIVDRSGRTIGQAGVNGYTTTDTFNNTVVRSGTAPITYKDTLGLNTLTWNPDRNDSSNSETFTYLDSTDHVQDITLNRSTTAFPVNFPGNCGGGAQRSIFPVTSISFPDSTSMSFTYEPGTSGNYTGRVASFTNRTGGTVSYAYSAPCTTSALTLSRTTPDGIFEYSMAIVGNYTQTTKLDPGKGKTVYTFDANDFYNNDFFGFIPIGWDNFLTEKDVYQNTGSVGSPTYAQQTEDQYCYNGNVTNCAGASVNPPITQRDSFHYVFVSGTATLISHRTETYDAYGNTLTDQLVDNLSSTTALRTTVYGTYSAGNCSTLTGIHDRPCTVTDTVNGTQVSQKQYAHNSAGFETSETTWLCNNCTTPGLTTSFVGNANGTVASTTLPNNQQITYAYNGTFGCNNLLPTSVSTTVNGATLTNQVQYDCGTGLMINKTDVNRNITTYTYDVMLRPLAVTDPLNFTHSHSYTSNSQTDSWYMTSPSASSATTTFYDSLGRPVNRQLTHGSSYDTVSQAYLWNGINFQVQSSEPCSQTSLGASNTCTLVHTAISDVLNRPISDSTTSNETLAFSYLKSDIQTILSPAPSNENNKSGQVEVDGLGRVTSSCQLLSSGGAPCGNAMGGSGILTTIGYAYAPGVTTVTTTRGAQVHKAIVDAAGRITSMTTPEAGTFSSVYDTVNLSYCSNHTSNGNLVNTVDAAGNGVCYYYDGLNRVTDVGNNNQSLARNACKRFRFDSTANAVNTAPSGYPSTGNNIAGRMFEATTDNCNGVGGSNTITDEWYAYDKDGRMTDMWELTNSSGGYYHTSVTYDINGSLATLSGIPGVTALSFGLDADGNYFNVEQGSTWLIGSSTTGIGYDPGGKPLVVPFGPNGDGDIFAYDSNTGNMTSYEATGIRGNQNVFDQGTLTWNANHTLGKLVIVDGFGNTSQTCNYGYDDIARLTSANCGSGYNETYSYAYGTDTTGQYGNLTKTGNPGNTFNPGYNLTNNQFQNGSTYDSAGNITYDRTNTYTWSVYDKMATLNAGTSQATCGSSGVCMTYDAMDRLVQTNAGGTIYQILYSPLGRIAKMSGQTLFAAYIPLPGGLNLWQSPTNTYLTHPDWLRTKRLATDFVARTAVMDTAYSPYGDTYDTTGSVFKGDFAGMQQDVLGQQLFDTPSREFAQSSSRWQSPDPAIAGWNAYAYPPNPNNQSDPTGLDADEQEGCSGDSIADPPCHAEKVKPGTGGGEADTILGKIWDWLTSGRHDTSPEEKANMQLALHAGMLTQNNTPLSSLNLAPYNGRFWQPATSFRPHSVVEIIVNDDTYSPENKPWMSEFVRGITDLYSLNGVDYQVVYQHGYTDAPYLTRTPHITMELMDGWDVGSADNSVGDGDNENQWLFVSHMRIARANIKKLGLYYAHNMGKHEETHNNGWGDCVGCERGTWFDEHVSTMFIAGEPTDMIRSNYWSNVEWFVRHKLGK